MAKVHNLVRQNSMFAWGYKEGVQVGAAWGFVFGVVICVIAVIAFGGA